MRSLLLSTLVFNLITPSAYAQSIDCAKEELKKEAGTEASYLGIRGIRFEAHPGDSPAAVTKAQQYLHTLANMKYLNTPHSPSSSFKKLEPVFKMTSKLKATLDPKDPNFLDITPDGDFPKHGNYRYIDLTNGTRLSTTDEHGTIHHFVSPRALREGYTVRVDLRTGSPSTEGYVSDQLIQEVKYDPKGNIIERGPMKPLIISTSNNIRVKGNDFVIEDGRIYEDRPGHWVLSGTIIRNFSNSGHLEYRVGKVALNFDKKTGFPKVETLPGTNEPNFKYISPLGDFKNGQELSTGVGKQVVTFLRPNLQKSSGVIPKGYSLLRLEFESPEAAAAYDYNHAVEDINHPENLKLKDRVRPKSASVFMTGDQLRDPHLADPRAFKTGFGPGSRPLRVRMGQDGTVYHSLTAEGPEFKVGKISKKELKGFAIQPGETKWIFPGHQLRYYHENSMQWRDYDGIAWMTNESMSIPERARTSWIQADQNLDLGQDSAIVDLARHVYPTGLEMIDGVAHLTYGASDRHTGTGIIDTMALLREMSDGSSTMKAGLSFKIGPSRH